jgi:hypothetical protein
MSMTCMSCMGRLQYRIHDRKVSVHSWHPHAASQHPFQPRPIEPPPNPYYLCPAPSSKPILKRRPQRDLWPHGPKTLSDLRSISWLRFYIRRVSLWRESVKPIGLKTKRAVSTCSYAQSPACPAYTFATRHKIGGKWLGLPSSGNHFRKFCLDFSVQTNAAYYGAGVWLEH